MGRIGRLTAGVSVKFSVIRAEEMARRREAVRPFYGEDMLAEVRAQAQRILEEARRQAEVMMRRAQEEFATARQRGEEAGYRDGLERGRQEVREAARAEAAAEFARAHADLLAALQEMVQRFEGGWRALEAAFERDVVRLACAIAERIVRRTVKADPGVAARTVEHLVRQIGAGQRLSVVMHPRDVEALASVAPQLWERLRGSPHIEIVAEASAAPGGCLVRLAEGEIDARWETQIEQIASQLLGDSVNDEEGAEGRASEAEEAGQGGRSAVGGDASQ